MKREVISAYLRGVSQPIALACTAIPFAAGAQLKPEVQTGSHIPTKPVTVDRREAGLVKKSFGRCIYRKDQKAAFALLQHSDFMRVDVAAAKIKNVAKIFDMETCLGDQVGAQQSALGYKFPLDTLHVMLAEEAYLSSHPTVPVLPANALEMVDRSYVSEGENLAKAKSLAMFADCVVYKNTDGADKLLRTMPASPEEKSAAKSLAPALGACLDEGAKVSLSADSIRGYVADGLWNRFSRPMQAAAAKP